MNDNDFLNMQQTSQQSESLNNGASKTNNPVAVNNENSSINENRSVNIAEVEETILLLKKKVDSLILENKNLKNEVLEHQEKFAWLNKQISNKENINSNSSSAAFANSTTEYYENNTYKKNNNNEALLKKLISSNSEIISRNSTIEASIKSLQENQSEILQQIKNLNNFKQEVKQNSVINNKNLQKNEEEKIEIKEELNAQNTEAVQLKNMLLHSLQNKNENTKIDVLEEIAKKSYNDISEVEKSASDSLEEMYKQHTKTNENLNQASLNALDNRANTNATNTTLSENQELDKLIINSIDNSKQKPEAFSMSESEEKNVEVNKNNSAINSFNNEKKKQNTASNVSPVWLQDDDWEDPFDKGKKPMDDDEFMKNFNP